MTRQGTPELLAGLKIEPEFEGKIPPLTEAEFQQLRENILEAGEVYEPIRVWNGTVVDGHNRLKVVREHPEVRWSVRDMEFADKWAAFDWMYKNQLGRRNLTDEQRTYMIGKMYEARKKSHGASDGFRGNQAVSSQNANLPNGRTPRTDEIIGKELGVNHSTVIRAEKFAKGIDALRELTGTDAADKVLSGKSKATKKQIATLGDLASESLEQAALEAPSVAEAIQKDEALPAITQPSRRGRRKKEPEPLAPQAPTITTADSSSEKAGVSFNLGRDAETREMYRMIESAYAPMLDTQAPSTYDLNDLEEEIRNAGEMCVASIRGTLEDRKYLFTDDAAWEKAKAAIIAVMDSIHGLTALKEEFTA